MPWFEDLHEIIGDWGGKIKATNWYHFRVPLWSIRRNVKRWKRGQPWYQIIVATLVAVLFHCCILEYYCYYTQHSLVCWVTATKKYVSFKKQKEKIWIWTSLIFRECFFSIKRITGNHVTSHTRRNLVREIALKFVFYNMLLNSV